mgnify:FL=1
MMKLALFFLCASGILAWVELRRRHRARLDGPHYVQRIREWYEQDAYGEEPTIIPLKLPPVKPLKAERDRRDLFRKLRRA